MTAPTIQTAGLAYHLIAPTDIPRDEWLELRREGVGGSDIGAIAGFSRYNTPFSVYLDKIGDLPAERSAKLERCARVGSKIEAFIAELFAEENGLAIERVGTLARTDAPWMRVNLDRKVTGCPDGPCFVEVKNRSQYLAGDWAGDVPDDTECQVHWGMAITGWSHGHVAALIGGNDPRYYRIDRDEQIIAGLTAIAEEFWDRVVRRDPPPVGPSDADAELIARLYADVDDDASVSVDSETARQWLSQRTAAIDAAKAAEGQRTEAENHLKQMLGTAAVALVDGDQAYSWRRITQRRINTEALRSDCPDVFAAYSTESTYRRFAVSVPRGDL